MLALAALLAACGTATTAAAPCAHATDCAGDTTCIDGACMPSTSCVSERMCPGLVCDVARGRCVECATAVDCLDGMACESGVCIVSSADDAGGTTLTDAGADAQPDQLDAGADAGLDAGTDDAGSVVLADAGADAAPDSAVDAGCSGQTWNAASEFRVAPTEANPTPDSYGNADVWRYLESASLTRDPSTYTSLSSFTSDWFGTLPSVEAWYDPSPPGGLPAGYSLTLGLNATGTQQTAWGQNIWAPNTLALHPGTTRLIILGWLSPVTGNVRIHAGLFDQNPACGNGVAFFVDRAATELGTVLVDNGGMGAVDLDSVAVSAGDDLYFIVDPRGDYTCDATQLDVTLRCL